MTLFRTLLTAAVLSISPLAAKADSVFLLQLGSFDNQDDARTRWLQLQEKYPQLLEGLSVRFQDVTLPPDNFTVFRTQAGALTNRSDAQIVCDRLTSRGDECYVVETAMFTGATQVATAMPAPRPSPVVEEMVAPVVEPIQQQAVQLEEALDEAQQDVAEMMDVPAAPAVAIAAPTITAAAPEMSVAAPRVTIQEEEDETLWDWINPFAPSDDQEIKEDIVELEPELPWQEEQAMAAVEQEMIEELRPQDMPRQTAIAPPAPLIAARIETPTIDPTLEPVEIPVVERPAMQTPTIEQPVLGQVLEPVIQPYVAEPVVQPIIEEESNSILPNISFDDFVPGFLSSDEEEDVVLPPPPPPVNPQSMQRVAQQKAAAVEQKRRARVSATRPTASGSIPFQVKRDGKVVTPSPQELIPGAPDVQVAEAVRVPVTQTQRLSPPPATVSQLNRLGLPSDTHRAKDLWAQVQYFSTQQQALAFWDSFRRANPTFPPARVRITNPYKMAQASNPRVSLRVGPFEHPYMIDEICAEVINEETNCNIVRDLGGSTIAQTARTTGSKQRHVSAQRRDILSREPMYWVQVGAYPTPQAAEMAWRKLRERHDPLLHDMSPDIAVPLQASNMDSVYRLRTGPYAMRPGADALCRHMQMKGTKCLTVFTR